jgi:predicted metal-dependent phosphoesterase TrpH
VLSAELHVHSSLSYDGQDSVRALLERASEVGLDVLAVTDHDEFEASLEATEIAPEYGLLGIPGMEISTAAGHVLAYGIETPVAPGLSFEETIERIHDQDGIAIVPHPFQEMRSGVLAEISPETLTIADAIEVYNSRLLTGWSNRQARAFARDHDMPMIAGSDAHVASMVGRTVTRIDTDERTVDAVLTAIREGRTELDGRRTPFRVSFRQAVGNTRRRIRLLVSDLFG